MPTSNSWGMKIGFIVLAIALILAVTGILIVTVQVMFLTFAGILFGIFLNYLTHWIADSSRLSYRVSNLMVMAIFLLLVGGMCYYAGSQIAEKVYEFSDELQTAFEQLSKRIENPSWQTFLSDLIARFREMIRRGDTFIPEIMTAAGWLTWGLAAATVIFFVGFYGAFDPRPYEKGLLALFPSNRRDRAKEVLNQLRETLFHWILGRLISMTIIGVATGIVLWLFNVPLSGTLGVIAAFLTFIPNIGPLVAMIPQAILAFQVSPITVLYVLLFNLVLQSVESYLVTPIVMRYQVNLPPALTIFVQLLMAVMVGAIGIVMAAPLTLVVITLVQTLYIREDQKEPEGSIPRE